MTKPDYLWDGSGEPDPELQSLEKSLSQFRHSGEVPNFPVRAPAKQSLFSLPRLASNWVPRLLATTLLLIAFVGSTAVLYRTSLGFSDPAGWSVAWLSGTPQVGRRSLTGESDKAQLKIGQLLLTDRDSSATVNVAEIGELSVDPGSRVRLIESTSSRKRVAVELGTIHAAIWAPPGEFVVDTPSATAVDLGCAYTLQVNEDGSGSLRTTLGWVGFHKDARDSFIPAGAMCSIHPQFGPGTPYFEDASEKFRAALRTFDFASESPEIREQSLRTVLAEARPRDAFTLWHLLFRVSNKQLQLVYDRLVSFAPLPPGVTRAGTLDRNPQMMDAWWNVFGLGDISIWRYFEQHQAPAVTKKAAR